MERQLQNVLLRLDRIEQLLAKLRDPPDNKKSFTLKEAAAYLRLSVSRMYSLIYDGSIKPIQRQRNSKILFTIEELNIYLSQDK
jgi:excisionase family DNA binding protein